MLNKVDKNKMAPNYIVLCVEGGVCTIAEQYGEMNVLQQLENIVKTSHQSTVRIVPRTAVFISTHNGPATVWYMSRSAD